MRDALKMGWDERTVTVNRLKLLETLKANREKHAKAYREAVDGYIEAATQQLHKQVAKARKAIDANAAMIAEKIKRFDRSDPMSNQVIVLGQTSFALEVPQDHTKSYDVAIQMAEWEVSDNIELTQSQFQCFVMDDWDWKESFESVSRSYAKRML